jgi:hypothetical protein
MTETHGILDKFFHDKIGALDIHSLVFAVLRC